MNANTDLLTPPPSFDTATNVNNIDINSLERTGMYDSRLGFEFPGAEHRRTRPSGRFVKIIVKDAHDDKGPGMTFEIKYFDSFKTAFDCFKAECCKTCRAVDEIRFKTIEKRVTETETPSQLSLKHKTTTEIRAWSNVPGLQCSECKTKGYPKTNGVVKPVAPNGTDTSMTLIKPETIALSVKDQTGFETNVKMLNTVSMDYLMNTYAERSLRAREHLRFFFEGEILVKTETPKQMSLINNDTIDVFMEQRGG